MARLRKPSPNEPSIFMPPSETRASRFSPRKATLRYASSQEDESSILVPKRSRRTAQDISISQDDEQSFRIPSIATPKDAISPRKQRVLRPVESNSRLLRKLSDESLASPEKKQRERRVRSGTTDTDVGSRNGLMYAKSLARSVVNKQNKKGKINVVGEVEAQEAAQRSRSREHESSEEIVADGEGDAEAETSLWCGDEEAETQEEVAEPVIEITEDDEEDEPVVKSRTNQRQPRARRVVSDSEEDESEPSAPQPTKQPQQPIFKIPELKPTSADLTSMRPPHRKGHSTISNWAQEVVDLTDSPEAPVSFMLPERTHARSSSFAASSRPTSSASNGPLAILRYSPTPTKQRSPRKAPPISRPATPPLAPPSPTKLVSPSKKKPVIPKAADLDGRPSLDAFWNPAAVNDWTDRHSPAKQLVSPKKQKWRDDIVKMMEGIALEDSSDEGYESPIESPKKKPTSRKPAKEKTPETEPIPNVKQIREQRKAFAERKHAIAEAFLIELDTTISSGRIQELSKSTGGIKLVWSKTLKTTAGRANWRREQIRIRTGPLPTDTRVEIRHHCSIELAEKVIDDEERLYNVLAHEFCHLTTFMISEVRNNPHGAEFKSWGRKATVAFASKGVEVTTKHSYQIEYKYVWECVSCGYEFKRHSKSIDPARHSCGKCKGKLAQTKPTPRGVGASAAVGKDGKREKSEYQVFVKANFARVKKELEAEGKGAQMGKVMEAVAKQYRERKGAGSSKAKEIIDLEAALDGMKI
ncbi:SprT-like family-domain-containing protein [Alternaria rosae]|uniref:SprT-like family-domain-containing protein n=1 Tax=Alternaria rosae TaxID=1187941 RepID=UPI001E8C9E64|nr:SprT-like family-domain-containing protein [Alternaria rosae]KAH6873264.1 SprT-like family-domain-containing protein [Alternaria rosae]